MKLSSHKEMMKDLKEKDPQLYHEIVTEAEEEVKNWGGSRQNAGRKSLYPNGTSAINKKVSVEAKTSLKEYAKKYGISESLLLNKVILLGLEQLPKDKLLEA